MKLHLLLFHDSLGNAHQAGLDPFQFLDGAGQRDHHFGLDHDAAQGAVGSSLEDGAHLHLDDLGHGDAQAHAAQTHHRVGFVQALDGFEQVLLLCQTRRSRP